MKEDEHQIQKAFTEWLRWNEGKHPDLQTAYAVPNGGHRSKASAGKAKAEGVKKGIPDYCFPFARGGFNALYIEFKTKTGTLSEPQKKIIPILRAQGNRVEIARSVDDGIEIVQDYLGG